MMSETKIFAIVYLRPDGWWEAGRGWDNIEDAKRDGEAHDWRGTHWGIINIDETTPEIEAIFEENLQLIHCVRDEQPKENNV